MILNLHVPPHAQSLLSVVEAPSLSRSLWLWPLRRPLWAAAGFGFLQLVCVKIALLLWVGGTWLPQWSDLVVGLTSGAFAGYLLVRLGNWLDLHSDLWRDLWEEEHARHQKIQHTAVLGLAQMTVVRDQHSGLQVSRIGSIVQALVQELARDADLKTYLSPRYCRDLVLAAPLHDIGRVGLPDRLLEHQGMYSSADEEMMRQHVILGGDLLGRLQALLPDKNLYRLAREIAYHHHQRYDGMGYPGVLERGGSVQYYVQEGLAKPLKGDAIPLSARIVAVADAYNAMRTDKPTRASMSHEQALVEVERACDQGAFDPKIVAAFLRCERELKFVIDGH